MTKNNEIIYMAIGALTLSAESGSICSDNSQEALDKIKEFICNDEAVVTDEGGGGGGTGREPCFYATFMQKQAFANYYVKIMADTMSLARDAMFDHFGEKFMTLYESEGFEYQITKYGLKELCCIHVRDYNKDNPNCSMSNVGYRMVKIHRP